MIIETVTVTTTPTSILALIQTARGESTATNNVASGQNDHVTEILFRCDSAGLEKVYIEESNTGTAVTLLNPLDQITPQNFASFSNVDLRSTLLSAETTTVSVGIIASQPSRFI